MFSITAGTPYAVASTLAFHSCVSSKREVGGVERQHLELEVGRDDRRRRTPDPAACAHDCWICSACSGVTRCCGFNTVCGIPPRVTAMDWLPAASSPYAYCA